MSSILNALKKLEEESPDQEIRHPGFRSEPGRPQNPGRKTGTALLLSSTLLLGTVALSIAFLSSPRVSEQPKTPAPRKTREIDFPRKEHWLPKNRQTKEKSVPSGKRAQVAATPSPVPLGTISTLSLQALSWNRLPEKRIAVISNRVVREGADLGEGILERIEKSHVIIRSGNRRWILK